MNSNGELISFPIEAMLDQSTDRNAGAEPGTLWELVNLRKDKNGRLLKRSGYRQIGTGASVDATRAISLNGVPAVVDNANISVFSETENAWYARDKAPQIRLVDYSVLASSMGGLQVSFSGVASAGGISLHVWQDLAGPWIKAMAVDEATGAIVRGPDIVNGTVTCGLVRVAAKGTQFWIVFQDMSAQKLWVQTPDVNFLIGNAAWPSPSNPITDLETVNPSFDIAITKDTATDECVIAYNSNNGGTHGMTVRTINASAAVMHTFTNAAQVRAVSVCSDPAGSFVWITEVPTAAPLTTTVRVLDTALTQLGNASGLTVTLGGAVGSIQSTGMTIIGSAATIVQIASATDDGTDPDGTTAWCKINWTGSVVSVGGTIRHYGGIMASAPFAPSNDVYCWLEYGKFATTVLGITDTTFLPFTCAVLVNLTSGGNVPNNSPSAVVGTMPHLRIAGGRKSWGEYFTSFIVPQKPCTLSSSGAPTIWEWDTELRFAAQVGVAAANYQFAVVTHPYDASFVAAEAQRVAHTSGAMTPYIFDGKQFTELGFVYAPPMNAAQYSSTNTGGLIVAGDYQAAVTYEYYDAAGMRHQSAPAFIGPIHFASGTTNTLIFDVPALRCTAKQDRESGANSNINIVVWRTTAGPSPVYYRAGQVKNNPEVTTVNVTEGTDDLNLATNEILYTSFSELANEMPPPLVHCIAFSGRMAGIDAEFRDRIVFSKPFIAERGAAWSSALETYVRGIGPLTALCEMDGVLYAFSATQIAQAAFGDGVDALGQGSWGRAQVVSRAAGCIDPRAICVTQDGAIFCSRSTDGLHIWLMPRGANNPLEIGRKVRAYTQGLTSTWSVDPTTIIVTSCVNWAAAGRAVISLYAPGGSPKSLELEYDYVNKGADGLGVWSVSSGTHDTAGVVSSVVANDKQCLLVPGNPWVVYRSKASSYQDEGGWISYKIQTHDIKPGSEAPFGKLNQVTFTLEERGANGGVQVGYTEDSGQTSLSATFPYSTVTVGNISQRQWQPPTRRSSKALGFGLSITSLSTGTADSQDVVPRDITIDYLPLRGTHRPQATERI